ncbi:contact-dependent growth inhibition system immunity protein [Streptomyces sp. NPDC006435]|uniref:contact-dependent growth inhibition system immunity protein n=1 Tax=Streptomyces sp. NPDC006435 TaxID=3154300 RepID=UPI0033BC49E1
MDHRLHLDRTLDELDPPHWAPPAADSTHLVRKVHELRRVPLCALGPADLRTLISQQVALPYVLPLAVRLLLEEPLLDACFYEGDLLLAAVNAPAAAWAMLPDLGARLRDVIGTLPEAAVADLPRGATEEIACFAARLESLR